MNELKTISGDEKNHLEEIFHEYGYQNYKMIR